MILFIIFLALCFEFINGFHDTANVVATSVATKALSPRQAIGLATATNLFGALVGTAVATTIITGIVVKEYLLLPTIAAALFGAIVWNLFTWWKGLPSSSSHALIGGLVGATLATSHGNTDAVFWDTVSSSGAHKGILWSVLLPMVISPVGGFVIAFLCIKTLKSFSKNTYPRLFRSLQICSASSIGFMHGLNDAQKTMGVITLCLTIATTQQLIPPFAEWLAVDPTIPHVPLWVKVLCALTMALGTAVGGWKIIKTMGFKIVKLSTREGFVAETSSATTVGICSLFGMPVSTTHNITASIVGAGSATDASKVSYKMIHRILNAWILTFPCAGILAALFEYLLSALRY